MNFEPLKENRTNNRNKKNNKHTKSKKIQEKKGTEAIGQDVRELLQWRPVEGKDTRPVHNRLLLAL